MGHSLSNPKTVRFGLFEVEFEQRLLTKAGLRVKLQDQPFEVLAMLLERPGEVITREEIRRRLWPADTFVEFDDGLNTAVKKLRAALSDVADTPRFIETVPRRGYRFVAPVTQQEPVAPAEAVRIEANAEPPSAFAPASTAGNGSKISNAVSSSNGHDDSAIVANTRTTAVFRRRLLFPALVAALAGIVALMLLVKLWPGKSPVRPEKATIIVIPLDNLSGDAQQDYFSDGITEEITTQLARLDPEHLAVIGRLTAVRYKNSHKDIAQIGREVPVQYVLEGSVRRDQTRFRVTVQLIEVAHQTHVWAEEYDRGLGDSLQLQRDIATAIAAHIDLNLTAEQQQKLAGGSQATAAAHDAYLKGRYEWNKRTEEGFRSAIKYFEQASESQPDYAPAYAGLADSYNLLGQYRFARQAEAYPKAKAYAQKALQIDGTLAEAWTALADLEIKVDGNWRGGERDFLRAIQLNGNYATAHVWYAEDYLTYAGRLDQAIAEMKKAQQIEPLSPMVGTVVAETFYVARDYDQAIREAKGVLEMEPGFLPALERLGWAYEQKRMFPEAIAAFQKALYLSPPDARDALNADLARDYVLAGRTADARRIISDLLDKSRTNQVAPGALALIYAALGKTNLAMDCLEQAYQIHESPPLRVDPRFDSLRADPRFQVLLKKVGPN